VMQLTQRKPERKGKAKQSKSPGADDFLLAIQGVAQDDLYFL